MTGKGKKYRSGFGWVVVAVTVGALVYYNIGFGIQQRTLTAKLAEARTRIEALKVESVEGEYARGSADVVWSRWVHERELMTGMLRQCKSHHDFVVREGGCITSCELSGATDRRKKIGIYLPAGKHWLKYVVANSGQLTGVETSEFLYGDPRQLAGAKSLELGPQAEVYEFEMTVGADEYPRIAVIGPGDVRIHEHTVPLVIRPGKAISVQMTKYGFALPSEFKPMKEERPYFLEPALPPVTELGLLQVSVRSRGGSAMVRVWIESDAPACMPAIYVAANYGQVTSLRYRYDNPPRSERVTDPDTEFARLFEPYDGSGRFIFREEIFLRPTAAQE